MSFASLLHYPDDPRGQASFSFDHAIEHDRLTAAMGAGASRFTSAYQLDPMPTAAMFGAGNWAQDHQQAHDDAAAWFSQRSLPLVDTSTSAGSLQQWLFTNSTEHDTLSRSALVASHG